MNDGLAEILKTVIVDNLNFADKVGGLVQVGYITKPELLKKENQTDFKFGELEVLKLPICYREDTKYDLFTPDKNKMSIMFFEDMGCELVEQNRNTIDYYGKLRLVCWVNYNKINKSVKRHHIIQNLIKVLTDTHPNSGYYTKIYVEFDGQDSNDPFANYDIDIAANQYLMYPYDAFALKFNCLFTINKNCILDLNINPEIC